MPTRQRSGCSYPGPLHPLGHLALRHLALRHLALRHLALPHLAMTITFLTEPGFCNDDHCFDPGPQSRATLPLFADPWMKGVRVPSGCAMTMLCYGFPGGWIMTDRARLMAERQIAHAQRALLRTVAYCGGVFARHFCRWRAGLQRDRSRGGDRQLCDRAGRRLASRPGQDHQVVRDLHATDRAQLPERLQPAAVRQPSGARAEDENSRFRALPAAGQILGPQHQRGLLCRRQLVDGAADRSRRLAARARVWR